MNATQPIHAVPPASRGHLSHVPELDGIRGLAALAVFCHHLLFVSVVHAERGNAFVVVAAYLSRYGLFGVDLFFVLSGYLITSILLLDRGRPHFYWNFYWKRALRIFPLYAVTLILIAIFLPWARRYVVLSALFLANFSQLFHVWADGPFWTLAIEEQFYLVWPRFAERMTIGRLRRMAIALAAVCLALRLIAAAVGHHDFRLTFFHCDGLAFGALLACDRFEAISNSRRTTSGKRLPLFLVAVALSLLAAFLPPTNKLGMAAEALQITGVSLVGFVLVRYAVEHTGSAVLGLLRSRALVFFGLISYCLYMSHLYILRMWEERFGMAQGSDATGLVVRFFCILAATVAVCVVSRYALELPAMRLRKHVLRKT